MALVIVLLTIALVLSVMVMVRNPHSELYYRAQVVAQVAGTLLAMWTSLLVFSSFMG